MVKNLNNQEKIEYVRERLVGPPCRGPTSVLGGLPTMRRQINRVDGTRKVSVYPEQVRQPGHDPNGMRVTTPSGGPRRSTSDRVMQQRPMHSTPCSSTRSKACSAWPAACRRTRSRRIGTG